MRNCCFDYLPLLAAGFVFFKPFFWFNVFSFLSRWTCSSAQHNKSDHEPHAGVARYFFIEDKKKTNMRKIKNSKDIYDKG